MKISVMITCFNCEESIDKAIQSVVSQNMPFEWELLLGDDGSSDKTIMKVQAWVEKYPKNISLFVMNRSENCEKSGTRAAKNRANLLERAKGEYLAFLDGDDELIGTDKFFKQVNLLDLPANENAACAAHNILVNVISENRKYPLVDDRVIEGFVDTKKYWTSLYFHTNTILFRNCCKNMMLLPEYRDYLNDNFITFIILQHGQIYYTRDIHAQYNITGDGIWTGKNRTFGCFRNLIIYDLELKISPKLKKESFIRHIYDILYISRNYNVEKDIEVKSLVKGLSKRDFPNTYLMVNPKGLTFIQTVARQELIIRANALNIWLRIVNFDKFIKRRIEH